MRLPFLISFLLLLSLSAYAHGQQPEPFTVTEPMQVFAAEVNVPAPYPLPCVQRDDHTFQIVWEASSNGTLGTIPPPDAAKLLRPILEKVAGLMVRSSNSITEARVPAFAMTDDCELDILYTDNWRTIAREDVTKYAIVEDVGVYCGAATVWDDESVGGAMHEYTSALIVDQACNNYFIWAHEIAHALGAAGLNAPNSDGTYHVTDWGDVLAKPLFNRCAAHDSFDCNNDDYYSAPWKTEPGSYLEQHWNIWNSPYLVSINPYPHRVYVPVMRRD